MGRVCATLLPLAGLLATSLARGQAIEFESRGLQYQTQSRAGLTVMCAVLPQQVRDYAVMQIAVSNGSPSGRTVKPEDFVFLREDGARLYAIPARQVVAQFLEKGGRGDVINLVTAYESFLFGINKFKSTNGYEVRRQQFQAEGGATRLRAAAAASAIVLVATRLQPGESTDGAVFFPTQGRPLGAGKLIVTAGVERFEFEIGGLKHPGELKSR